MWVLKPLKRLRGGDSLATTVNTVGYFFNAFSISVLDSNKEGI